MGLFFSPIVLNNVFIKFPSGITPCYSHNRYSYKKKKHATKIHDCYYNFMIVAILNPIDIPVDVTTHPSRNISAKEGETVMFQCIAHSPVRLVMSWIPPCKMALKAGR